MPEKIHIITSEIERASLHLCELASHLTHTPTPTQHAAQFITHHPHLTTAVEEFLSGLRIAHQALIDTTRSTSTELASLLNDHTELDAHLAARIPAGYELPGEPK